MSTIFSCFPLKSTPLFHIFLISNPTYYLFIALVKQVPSTATQQEEEVKVESKHQQQQEQQQKQQQPLLAKGMCVAGYTPNIALHCLHKCIHMHEYIPTNTHTHYIHLLITCTHTYTRKHAYRLV